MKLALVQNGILVQIVEVENEIEASVLSRNFEAAIDLSDSEAPPIGTIFSNGSFIGHEKKDNTKITRLAFRSRLSAIEKATIYTIAKTNVSVQVWIDDLMAATYVDLTRPDTIGTIQYMASVGMISPARVPEILSLNIKQEEVWNG